MLWCAIILLLNHGIWARERLLTRQCDGEVKVIVLDMNSENGVSVY